VVFRFLISQLLAANPPTTKIDYNLSMVRKDLKLKQGHMLYIYLSFCGGALIFDHLHDGSNGRFKELGYIRSGLKICKYPSGSRCFLNRPLPEELQLTRFYIKFRCTVPQASELDIKSLI